MSGFSLDHQLVYSRSTQELMRHSKYRNLFDLMASERHRSNQDQSTF